MDCAKIGKLIYSLRKEKQLTQDLVDSSHRQSGEGILGNHRININLNSGGEWYGRDTF